MSDFDLIEKDFTCVHVFMLQPATLLRKRLWHGSFPVNFAKFIRTPFLTEDLRWLPLDLLEIIQVPFSHMVCRTIVFANMTNMN